MPHRIRSTATSGNATRFKQRRSARVDVGIERVAETRQRSPRCKPSLHAGSRAVSPRVVEQRTDPQAGAAMHRTKQRRQAGQRRGGKRCAGRCRDARREGRRVEFVIGRQDEGDADRLAGVLAAVPGAGKAFGDRDAIGKVGAKCGRQRAQQHRCLNHQRRSRPALGRVASRGQPGPASKAPPRPAAGPSLKAGSSKAGGKFRHVPQQRGGFLQRGAGRKCHGVAATIEQPSSGNSRDRGRQYRLRPMRSRSRQPRPPGGHARAARAGASASASE